MPYSLAKRKDISPGAKLLFGELAAIFGSKGYCPPSLDHLAERLGASVDQVKRWIQELTTARLIKSRRRGPGSNAERIFLWHPSLGDSPKPTADLESAKIRLQEHQPESADSRFQEPAESGNTHSLKVDICTAESGNLHRAYKEEEVLLRGSTEEVSSSIVEAAAENWQPNDDDNPL